VEAGFEVRRCSGCGLGLTWPPVPDAEIGSFYPATYYGRENVRFNVLFERLTRLFRLRRARVIRRRISPGPVLDVGCGRGFTLNYLRDLGFTPRGIELSETAAWHARRVLGLDVETGDFLKSSHRAGSFHAVIFWHSLEHMARPAQALRRARELLKPGGLLVVAVPNFSSLQARLFGRDWFHLDVPRHYVHFSSEALARLLEREGFRIAQTDHFSFEQNPYGWVQSALNALGFDFNFLYAALKNRSGRTFQLRRHPVQALLTAVIVGPFTLLALILTLAEAALRRGGTVEVYAVKE
jgi:2-polyprenyl-3-methyl-5-hydroxy-6-metoxy-1,4-benzoquinol methylase